MTYEEAIELLDTAIEVARDEMAVALLMAYKAVEKQIPKKPYIDNENGVYEKEYCPTCHRSLFPNDHHCRCGQALDWSEGAETYDPV